MEKINPTEPQNLERLKKLAKELDELQKQENDGRGVSCVQSVASYLKSGLLDEAKQLCRWDHDKIRNYPKLVEFIKTHLFEKGEEHPWDVWENLKKR